MKEYREIIKNAQPGQIIPIVKRIDMDEAVDFFAKISNYGRTEHCFILESKEYLSGTSALTFGTAKPALYLTGKGVNFEIRALTDTGRSILNYLAEKKERFNFCESVNFGPKSIIGRIKENKSFGDEQQRLTCTNQMDVLRAVAFAFKLASKPFRVTCGLMGALSYDFIDQFETLPASKYDSLENPDYELYFADNIFLMDHENNQGYVVVNVIVTDKNYENTIEQTQKTFDYYFNLARFDTPKPKTTIKEIGPEFTDTDQGEYEAMVEKAKKHILDGDIFQVVLSRTTSMVCKDEPLDIYRRLSKLNPSPYMFYIKTPTTILMGSSPELNLRISGTDKRCVEIRPIAGTKPR
ncbi:MAG TPA: chorismate-binding protein, partial [Sedimentisphaerales bacterium]|nr:chorismate-binding protein [Sedimentisphaerales bacterium]